jgi:hypothetical protein
MPFAIYTLGGGVLAEYAFIIVVSVLFLYSSLKIAKTLKIRQDLFYIFSLTPFTLFFGLINGTELLNLALIELFIAFLMEKRSFAGFFLGLAFLARYSSAILLPLVLIVKKPKGIAKNIVFFAAPIIPWLVFNFYQTGNMFTSIADTYALDVKYRFYISQFPDFTGIVKFASFFAPLIAIGLVIGLRNRKKINLLFLLLLVVAVYQYATTPIKETRYLFPIVLPLAYFAVIGSTKIKSKVVVPTLLIFCIAHLVVLSAAAEYQTANVFRDSIAELRANGISNCTIQTNAWPLLNYLGQPSDVYPRKEMLANSVTNSTLLFFYRLGEPYWANGSFLSQFKTVYNNSDFIILGGTCTPPEKVSLIYMESLKQKELSVYNITINTNPCFVLFENNPFEEVCNFMNGKGFTKDANRENGIGYVRD